nr:hypothetical protein [Geobacillus kaustophilus]
MKQWSGSSAYGFWMLAFVFMIAVMVARRLQGTTVAVEPFSQKAAE